MENEPPLGLRQSWNTFPQHWHSALTLGSTGNGSVIMLLSAFPVQAPAREYLRSLYACRIPAFLAASFSWKRTKLCSFRLLLRWSSSLFVSARRVHSSWKKNNYLSRRSQAFRLCSSTSNSLNCFLQSLRSLCRRQSKILKLLRVACYSACRNSSSWVEMLLTLPVKSQLSSSRLGLWTSFFLVSEFILFQRSAVTIAIVMYDDFTAQEQKALHMKLVNLDPKSVPRFGKRKRVAVHSKNPYKVKKVLVAGEEQMKEKVLDGFLLLKLLNKSKSENALIHPREIIKADLSFKRIVGVRYQNLKHFVNLRVLDVSQNYLKLEWFKNLPALESINLSNNQIAVIRRQEIDGAFPVLTALNLGYNMVDPQSISSLSALPVLQSLSLAGNELKQLPEDLSQFAKLKRLELGSNQFRSEHKANFFWSSLATVPHLAFLSIERNSLRGIHTEKLMAGDFQNLRILDFSFNAVENQHNLICARNFPKLQQLIITGNPFAVAGEFKGLEMEVFARTSGQVINEDIQYPYLRKIRRMRMKIKFDKIVKVKPDDWVKDNKYLFGMEMPADEDEPSEEESVNKEEVVSEPDETNTNMFITEDPEQKPTRIRAPARATVKEEPSFRESERVRYEDSDFRKIAQTLLGKEKQSTFVDINAVYKQLRHANKKAEEDIIDLLKGSKGK